uniref:D-serine dehydratase n=1 Tax=Ciona savignyi TaxID=51511 RepID=H2ZEA5_CIOSA
KMQKISDLETPALVVYKHIVAANCKRMYDLANSHGVILKPHFKTSKCLEVAIMLSGGTKRGIEVSTLAEADFLAKNGFDDIIYAFPLSSHKITRCAALSEQLEKFTVFVDDPLIIQQLDKYKLKDKKWSILVEVDVGGSRSGVQADSPLLLNLVEEIKKSDNLTFAGLYSHCGQSYGCTNQREINEVARAATTTLLSVVERLKTKGINCPSYGIGSTPSCSRPVPEMSKLTEWHPGNYVFNDQMQVRIGSCKEEDIACFVLTRVVSHYNKKGDIYMIINCGWTALSLHGGGDCGGRSPNSGFGFIQGHPELKLSQMSQEHGIVRSSDQLKELDLSRYPIGSLLRVYPDHSCGTCAMHSTFYVADQNDVIIDEWTPVKGW